MAFSKSYSRSWHGCLISIEALTTMISYYAELSCHAVKYAALTLRLINHLEQRIFACAVNSYNLAVLYSGEHMGYSSH
jgi:hypothetical protein